MLYVLLLWVACVEAISFPSVRVGYVTLTKYGVMKNINEEGFFENAFRKFQKAVDEMDNTTLSLHESMFQSAFGNIMTFPPAKLSTSIISMASFVDSQDLAQFATGHILNVWERYHQTASDLNSNVYNIFKHLKLTNFNTQNMQLRCMSNRLLLKEAHKHRTVFDPELACKNYVDQLCEDPSILSQHMQNSERAEYSLQRLKEWVEDGESKTLEEMNRFTLVNPVFDTAFGMQFEEMLAERIKDYSEVIAELLENPLTAPFIREMVGKLTHFGSGTD